MSNYRLKAAVLLTALIGGGLFLYEPPKPVKVERPKEAEPVQGFGFVDFDLIQEKIPNSAELKELRGREIRLRLELNEVMRPVMPPKIPEIDTTPISNSAREKNMQSIISQLAELKARKKRLAEEYRKQTEPEYIRHRDEVTRVYLNEAFNITLKIQNADVLRLTPEQVQELQKKLDALVLSRNESQLELLNDWTAQINNYVEEQTAGEEARIRREGEESLQKYNEEAVQKIRDIQERNRAIMDAAAQEVAVRQVRRREILDELTKTADARVELENKILDDIVDEAGKLGALHRLRMVFVKRTPNFAEEKFFRKLDANLKLEAKKPPGAMIFSGDGTKDLTPELLKALRL